MKSRIAQLAILIVTFIIGLMVINSCSGPSTSEVPSNEGYVPPAP